MAQRADLKKRINSVTDIKQMTNAMQLISAVKMRRARSQLETTMPFFAACAETMVKLCDAGFERNNPFFQLHHKKRGETWKIGYFILTGEQGLAGAYNMNVISTATNHIRQKIMENVRKDLKTSARLFVAGKIGKEQLIREGFDVVADFQYPISEPTYYRAREISDFIHDLYDNGELDLIYFVYTQIESSIAMKPIVTRILPVNPSGLEELIPGQYRADYGLSMGGTVEYRPEADDVLNHLISTYLTGMVYGALTESYASEQTARMIAMDHATENAEELLRKLTIKSNQARQNRITNELAEIVGGAEVLQAQQ
ncbi:MAG: ATP synthase F1 subunit gamma [Saccharofermentanales bacterium]|jgi:F-type H+-transporting ATPase subunit gamma|nr:ATP synthase F1 subunit gamma [Clostridiaceae bacterium]